MCGTGCLTPSLDALAAQVDAGCDIIDCATASLADATSQPSLNAFCASLAGHPRDPKIPCPSRAHTPMHAHAVPLALGPLLVPCTPCVATGASPLPLPHLPHR